MELHQIIHTWWIIKISSKFDVVYKDMIAIIMWSLWKSKNGIKHGGKIDLKEVIWQVQDLIRKFIKVLYPWMRLVKEV